MSRRYRMATAGARVMPDVVNIGVQKGGTTSLFHYVSQHPQVLPSRVKEVHYFDGGTRPTHDSYAAGERWYRSNFPLRRRVGADQRVLEASPLYFFQPEAAGRLEAALPDCKLIVLLRDPVERAISHYFHQHRLGHEPLPLLDALLAEDERLAPALAAGDYKDHHFLHHSYQRRGRYAEQLRRYTDRFPEEQILLLQSEPFFADPAGSLREVFAFMGVDPDFVVPNLRAQNPGRNRSEVDPAVSAHLSEHFRPHNAALFSMLGTTFDWT